MFENIYFENKELISREKMYLSVPIDKECKLGINLTITNPNPKKIFNRINKFYSGKIDENLKERYDIKGDIWKDVLGDIKVGVIVHRKLDIFMLNI